MRLSPPCLLPRFSTQGIRANLQELRQEAVRSTKRADFADRALKAERDKNARLAASLTLRAKELQDQLAAAVTAQQVAVCAASVAEDNGLRLKQLLKREQEVACFTMYRHFCFCAMMYPVRGVVVTRLNDAGLHIK